MARDYTGDLEALYQLNTAGKDHFSMIIGKVMEGVKIEEWRRRMKKVYTIKHTIQE